MHIPGGMNLIVIMAVVLLIFGPNKLPEIARSMAKAMNEFRGAMRDVTHHLDFTSTTPETRVYPGSTSSEVEPYNQYHSDYAQASVAPYENHETEARAVPGAGPSPTERNESLSVG